MGTERVPPSVEFTFDNTVGIARAKIPASLHSGGNLKMCLVQTKRATAQQILSDESRPDNVAAVLDLIQGGKNESYPALRDLVPGNDRVLIVLPEYALSFSDWSVIDSAIRKSQQPLILFAGFGATPGHEVLKWAKGSKAQKSTRRLISWEEDKRPTAPNRPLNGAWVWIHGFGFETTAIVYIKNHFEQSQEAVFIPDLQSGHMLLQMSFEDVDVYPMICADIIQSARDSSNSCQYRIQKKISEEAAPARRVLLVGSLYQTTYNKNWVAAVDACLNSITVGRSAIVALANIATELVDPDVVADRWRSLTGVFGRFDEHPRNQKNLPAARALDDHTICGAVVRTTQPQVVSGEVVWPPYRPTSDLFVWHAETSMGLGPSGVLRQAGVHKDPTSHELLRQLARTPVEPNWSPRVSNGLSLIKDHLQSGEPPTAERIMESVLFGVARVPDGGQRRLDVEKLHDEPFRQSLELGLCALATLATRNEVAFQADLQMDGQLVLSTRNTHILIWQDPGRSPQRMLMELSNWLRAPGPHPHLLAFVGGKFGSPRIGPVAIHPRSDISAAPDGSRHLRIEGSLAETRRTFTEPRIGRTAECRRLDSVSEIYADYVELEEESRLDSLFGHSAPDRGDA